MAIPKFKVNNDGLIAIPFIIFLFILSRMFPLMSYSWLMNIALIFFFILKTPSIFNGVKNNKTVIFFIIILSVHGLYSLFLNNDPSLVIKFYFVLIFILFSYFCAFNSLFIVNAFIFIMSIQAIVVISIAIFLMVVFRDGNYLVVRAYFLDSGYGDVYTYGSGFYRVQLKGNALLPFSFMISELLRSLYKDKYKISSSLLFVSCIFAGNFAFYISIFIFIVFSVFGKNRNIYNNVDKRKMRFILKIALGLILLSSFPLIIRYAISVIEMKSFGAGSSLGVRYDQFYVLISDMLKTWHSTVFGSGLGNLINVQTAERNYSDNVYYELQTVYFLNQLGIVLFISFVLLNVILSIRYVKSRIFIFIYCLYCAYAVTNPYILDSNQIVVIVILCTLNKIGVFEHRVCN
ncbi:polymerase [Pectobacterium versatile]|uniref:polymerase n=1 Tax=Pectobacterium versatile TaxID=2488639 RepID=UPI001F2D6336|nr:polymerase [Pectobacterium versatile]